MNINFKNYLASLPFPKTNIWLPMFEAISNSIDSIEDADISNGKIEIQIIRQSQEKLFEDFNSSEQRPVKSIIIRDNGTGFTPSNLRAFFDLYTVNKKSRGGKGVGRGLWLIAFHEAFIRSNYFDENGAGYSLEFPFTVETRPSEAIPYPVEKQINSFAQVELLNLKSEFFDFTKKDLSSIAEEIVIHFLPYFMSGKVPVIELIEKGVSPINLNAFFEDFVLQGERDEFSIGNNRFDVFHMKTRYKNPGNRYHRLFYIANQRVVEKKNLTEEMIPNLPERLVIDDEAFVYVGYVESVFFDENVDNNRFALNFGENSIEDQLFPVVTRGAIEDQISKSVSDYLKNFTTKNALEKKELVRDYINNEEPSLAYLFDRYYDRIDRIPLKSLGKDKIGSSLNDLHYDQKKELNKEVKKMLVSADPKSSNPDEIRNQITRLLEEINPTAKADLAEYIAHRRVMLQLINKALEFSEVDKYEKERKIHEFIFPLNKTSEELDYQAHNLWILDDRLAYNSFIASDKAYIDGANNRFDIFSMTFATAILDETDNSFETIDLFELKRPMRDDYGDSDNPILQITNYLEQIREKKLKTIKGRPIHIDENAVIYCHVICDITPSLERILKNAGYQRIGNCDWYILFHTGRCAYIEVRSFDFMLKTATKRNNILFSKLGI